MQQNPYLDKRDFRAVIFRGDGLESISDVASLFGSKLQINSAERSIFRLRTLSISRVRATYFTETLFLRSADPVKREAIRARKKSDMFQYELYILSLEKNASTTFLVAIPFSTMAREVFGVIHQNKPSSEFRYLKPRINDVVAKLIKRFPGSERVKMVGINWTVAGDSGHTDQLVLRGSDVIHSQMFRDIKAIKSSLSLHPRKLLLRYENRGGDEPLKVAFDKFGNYSIWVRSEGQNLPIAFQFFDLLERSKLVEDEVGFPVRRMDESPYL